MEFPPFVLLPLELHCQVFSFLTLSELFHLTETCRVMCAYGLPWLYERDAKEHTTSVPRALMFAALISTESLETAQTMVRRCLHYGGDISYTNVRRRRIRLVHDEDIWVTAQATFFHVAALYGSAAFLRWIKDDIFSNKATRFPKGGGGWVSELMESMFRQYPHLRQPDLNIQRDLRNLDEGFRRPALRDEVDGGSRGLPGPLSYALARKDWDVIEALLSFLPSKSKLPLRLWGYSGFVPDESRTRADLPSTLLHWAAKQNYADHQRRPFAGDLPLFPDLIRLFSRDLEGDGQQETCLVTAIRAGNVRFVSRLLRQGFDPNTRDIMGMTALMHACRHYTWRANEPTYARMVLHCVTELLEHGADPNIEVDGQTVLEAALNVILGDAESWAQSEKLAKTLVARSTTLDYNAPLADGSTLTQRICGRISSSKDDARKDHLISVLEVMVEHGANLNLGNPANASDPYFLYQAIITEDFELAKTYKALGAKVIQPQIDVIFEDMWFPGDKNLRQSLSAVLGKGDKNSFGLPVSTQAAARMFSEVVALELNNSNTTNTIGTTKQLFKLLDWPAREPAITETLQHQISRLPHTNPIRKFWLERGFNASGWPSLNLLVLDPLEGGSGYTETKAVEEARALIAKGAEVDRAFDGEDSALVRIRRMRRNVKKGSNNAYLRLYELFMDLAYPLKDGDETALQQMEED